MKKTIYVEQEVTIGYVVSVEADNEAEFNRAIEDADGWFDDVYDFCSGLENVGSIDVESCKRYKNYSKNFEIVSVKDDDDE